MPSRARKKTKTPAKQVKRAPHAEEAWQTVVKKRLESPPLRFTGREIARNAIVSNGVEIAVALWLRRTGGYVASLEADAIADSVSCSELDEAMLWLETLCGAQSPFTAIAAQSPVAYDAARMIARHQAFRVVAGESMDRWDRIMVEKLV